MFRYSGPLLSFVVVAVCLGINITRYPIVWEMLDKTTFAANAVAHDAEIDTNTGADHLSEQLAAKTETEPKTGLLGEGSPVPPPLGGSPSPSSSTRTLFTTNLSKTPPENVSPNGYAPIPAVSVPNHRIASQVLLPAVDENEPATESIAANEYDRTEEEEDFSDYQPIQPQPVYAARYEEQIPEPDDETLESDEDEEVRELTPEEKVEAFKNSPLDLMPPDDSDSEFSDSPVW